MRVVWLIARKYFFSSRNPSAINIISGISMVGYAIGAMALIVLLSALNGFEAVIFGGYANSDADLKVVPINTKVFAMTAKQLDSIKSIPNVMAFYRCLEDKAIVKYGDQQVVARIKGVDSSIFKTVRVDSMILAGNGALQSVTGERAFCWLSEGLIYKLGISGEAPVVDVMVPDRTSGSLAQTQLNEEALPVSTMVRLGEDLNEATVFVPFTTAENLFVRESEMSSLELRVKGSIETVQKEVQHIVGHNFEVLDRRQQHRTMYKMFNTEKWVSFALLAFILLLISFNLFGALRMMWIDKANDTLILDALGMSVSRIQNIFRLEGILVVLTGTLIGIALGIALVYLQLRTGLVTTQSTMAMAYPVKLQWSDLWLVTGLNLSVGLLVSLSLPFKRNTDAI